MCEIHTFRSIELPTDEVNEWIAENEMKNEKKNIEIRSIVMDYELWTMWPDFFLLPAVKPTENLTYLASLLINEWMNIVVIVGNTRAQSN